MDTRDEVVLTLTDDMDINSSSNGPHNKSTQRLALVGHFIFRLSALVIYLFCTWFTNSFVLPFIFILLSLSLDFWFVKNISGRVLVGLRWSSYTNEQGEVNWRFDARQPCSADTADSAALSRRELAARSFRLHLARLFWFGLIGAPIIWFVFLIAAVFSLHLRWALISGIALCMSSANMYGFIRCRMSSLDQNTSALINWFKSTTQLKTFPYIWSSSSTNSTVPNTKNVANQNFPIVT